MCADAGRMMQGGYFLRRKPTPITKLSAVVPDHGCERAGFYHWTKAAAEIARLLPEVEMDVNVMRGIVTEEERHLL